LIEVYRMAGPTGLALSGTKRWSVRPDIVEGGASQAKGAEPSPARQNRIDVELGKGSEDESPLVHPGMGDHELRLLHLRIAEGQDVDVDGSRAPSFPSDSSQPVFYPMALRQEFARGQRCGDLEDGVEIVGLGRADRCSLVDPGAPEDLDPIGGRQPVDRLLQVG
jgi:hypothetical protein